MKVFTKNTIQDLIKQAAERIEGKTHREGLYF